MDLNRATLIGNVTRDPEMRALPSGQNVATFGVATNMMWTDAQGQKQQRTEFHNIVAWGKLAEICKQYLSKGKKIFIEGRLQTREWEAQDSTKKMRTEIVAENMIMLNRGSAPGTGSAANAISYQSTTPAGTNAAPSAPAIDHGVGDQEIRIEDIPF